MELIEGIKSRRSIRKFEDRPVPREVLASVVDVAAYAPTWKNTQISRYIAIEDKAVIAEIAEKFASFNSYILGNTPLLIAQTCVTKRSGYERDGSFTTDRGDGWQMYDCGCCAQTFALAAHEAGLGTVIMGIFDRLALQEYLKLPENEELVALIACGYPAQEPKTPPRKTSEVLLRYL